VSRRLEQHALNLCSPLGVLSRVLAVSRYPGEESGDRTVALHAGKELEEGFDDFGGVDMRNTRMAGMAGVGDQIEARGLHGQPSRHGKVVELLGSAGHEHYRVRWDDEHESILFPSDGVIITSRATGRGALAEHSD
jgi:hypothetical protein